MQGIEIPIGAPLGQLDKDLKNAKGKLNSFAAEADKSSAILGGSVARGSNQAAFALNNLGRVAQDAPFGFIGIQNNLNPLLESFQQLKQQTGSTGSALKALGQSLIGPAGIGIALSVVSSAILFYQQYQQRANKEVVTAKKVTDEYINSLGQIDQARLKGAQNAQSELTTLKLLYNQYQNSNLPIEQRKDAYKEIQKLYPAYFGNLQFETTATDKTKNAYNGLTESILASARARAAADLITKNSTRQLENEQKVIDLTKQILTEQTKQKQLQNTVDSQNLLAKQEANILTSKQRDILNQYLKAGYKEAELTRLKNNLLTDTNLLTEKNIQLEKAATAEVLKGGKVSGNIGGKAITKTTPKFDRTQIKLEGQEGVRGPQFKVESSLNELDLFIEKYRQTEALLNKTPLVPFPGLKEKLNTVTQEFIEWNANIASVINGSLVQTFASIGDAIGQSLSTGTSLAQNLGSVLLNSLGSVLGQLGQMAIGTGVALLGIKTALKTLNPFVAIAAGTALLALSGVVRGQANKLSSSMGGSGSGSSGGFSTPVPQTSASISTSAAGSAQDFGGGSVVFEISGTNLIGVLNRAGAKLQRFGP